jgi:predicted Mrr-cat superfamily restriction endonuclease
MMWVIRAGQNALHYDKYIQNSKVYIPWDGYNMDLSGIKTRADFRTVVEKEKGTDNRTSVSNWAGQLYTFTQEMETGDFVLIPSKGSHTYCLAKISGEYRFNKNDKDKLYHCRDIDILEMDIPRDIFSQSVIYSLGAFRTIFKAKHEDEIMNTINKWKEERR